MTEQSTTDYWIQITACWGQESRWRHTNAVNGGVPQVGQMLGGIWDGAMGRTWFITEVLTSAPSFSVIPCTPWAQATDPCDKPLYTGTTCCPQLCGTITGGGNTTDSNSGLSPTWMPNQPIPASITGLHNIGCSGSGPKCCGNSSYDPIQMSSNWFMVQYFGQVGTPLCSGYTGTHSYCDVCCCTPENAPVNEQVADIGCRNGTFYHATNPDCECKPGEIQVDCTWQPGPPTPQAKKSDPAIPIWPSKTSGDCTCPGNVQPGESCGPGSNEICRESGGTCACREQDKAIDQDIVRRMQELAEIKIIKK